MVDELATPEQRARDLLERAGVKHAQDMTAGDLVEIANLIVRADRAARADAHPVADIRFPEDQGPFGFPTAPRPAEPVSPIPHGWLESTFTVEVTCLECGAVTTTSAQRLRFDERTVHIPGNCRQCGRSGEFSVDRAEIERRFPDAKL